MENTTLCYIEKDGCCLMLHRIKKEHDINRDKYIGIGGKFEDCESPEDCLLREVQEETGLTLNRWIYQGIVTFVSKENGETYYELMHLFSSRDFSGTLKEDCDEGVLEWVPWSQLFQLNLWEGDHIFLKLMEEGVPFFSLKLVYEEGVLTQAELNGDPLQRERYGTWN